MSRKSSADYQRAFRTRMREQGLIKKEVWVRPEYSEQLATVEKQLRLCDAEVPENLLTWNTRSLFRALEKEDRFTNGKASIEVIEGISPVLHIIMHEPHEVAMFATISGNQIIVESTLCAKDDIADIKQFNEAVLRSHKYFPLSTVGLESDVEGQDFYFMFGALSSTSILQNVLLELEVLAKNVQQAKEAFADFFRFDIGEPI